MKELAAIKFVEQRSRFFAHLYRLDSRDDIDGILKTHRRKYKKANHHCYAVWLASSEGDDANGTSPTSIEQAKDDGEVGHPGKVLLEILKRNQLDSHALVVSRVFGGVKLGVGGVSRAFREAGTGVVERRQIKYE